MKKHIVFDFDDTLTNSYGYNQQMFVDTFTMVKKPKDIQFLRDLHFRSRGKAMHLQFEEAINYLKIKADPIELTKINEEIHKASFEKVTMFEGTEQLLKTLKENNKKISICTNRQYGSLKNILDHNNLTTYFDNIISCKDEGHEKPDPYCLIDLVKKDGLEKDAYVYFGDSRVDYDFAEGAGIDFIIIDQYINKNQLFKILLQAIF